MTVLGCIADDFTGGTDVAAALRRAGLRVALHFGVPTTHRATSEVDAVVVALKTRTVPADEAVAESVTALRWLREQGATRFYLKYCSTFDSTPAGNIGPVADALLAELGETTTLICPATPEHGRTVYRGHLFVGDDLLSESSMRHHPLTPMTEARLDRVLAPQTDGRIGTLALTTVHEGAGAVAARLKELRSDDVRHVVVDAVDAADLDVVAAGAADLVLLTGGAGLAGALGPHLRGATTPAEAATTALPAGPVVVLAGSCSTATLGQVEEASAAFASYRLDPAATPDPDRLLADATTWLEAHLGDEPVLVYSSAGPEDRAAAVAAMGDRTADVLEQTLAALARTAVDRGARRAVVAGGETSGAVVRALGIDAVTVAGEEDPGVPWCVTDEPAPLALLLKSGNFGAPDLLVRAARKDAR